MGAVTGGPPQEAVSSCDHAGRRTSPRGANSARQGSGKSRCQPGVAAAMPDYGHELQFGSFLTPANRDPPAAGAPAQASERAGLDLVTFQDHPYQPRFLDTWTLLSALAAKTSTVRLAPNVANLPRRPPAVLARSVASLDILSHGRVELGLGAGAFWDAIAANGGRRLTPGQGVTALGEAIDVIRAIWGSGPVRIEGEHYTVR